MICYLLIALGTAVISAILMYRIVQQECAGLGYDISVFYHVTSKQKFMIFSLFVGLFLVAPGLLVILLNKKYRLAAKEIFINKFYAALRESI